MVSRPRKPPTRPNLVAIGTDGWYTIGSYFWYGTSTWRIKRSFGCVDDNKDEIIDCVEKYVMTFSIRSIECCVGGVLVLDSVAEVCLIELQPTAPSTGRNRKPIPSEKRKCQRVKKSIAKRVEITNG